MFHIREVANGDMQEKSTTLVRVALLGTTAAITCSNDETRVCGQQLESRIDIACKKCGNSSKTKHDKKKSRVRD